MGENWATASCRGISLYKEGSGGRGDQWPSISHSPGPIPRLWCITCPMRRLLAIIVFPCTLHGQGVEPWQIIVPPQASIIFARDGSMIGEIGKETRFNVPLR